MSFKIGDKVKVTNLDVRSRHFEAINMDRSEIISTYQDYYVVGTYSDNLYLRENEIALVEEKTNPVDPKKELVNSPDHYKSSGMEAIDVIEAFNLGFNLGNTVKYILRCGKKDSELQELKKAKWYLEREISRREK